MLDARDSYGKPPKHVTKAVTRERRRKRGRYEVIVKEQLGYIRDVQSGEVMHPGTAPEQEARSLYVEQSRLIERLQTFAEQPLVVWDVGLGSGANAMSAILSVEDAAQTIARPLELLSFENDLDSLKLALDHPAWFKHLRHAAPRALLQEQRWQSRIAPIEWRLMAGDFAQCKFRARPPDIVFFDPFSFKTDSALWTTEAFRELLMAFSARAAELFTYTYSTAYVPRCSRPDSTSRRAEPRGPRVRRPSACHRLRQRDRTRMNCSVRIGSRNGNAAMRKCLFGSKPDDASWRDAVARHPQFI